MSLRGKAGGRPVSGGTAVVELFVAVVALVGSVLLWRGGVRVDSYGPLLAGSPGFTTTYYAGPWIGASVAAAGLAVLLVVDALRRLRTTKTAAPES